MIEQKFKLIFLTKLNCINVIKYKNLNFDIKMKFHIKNFEKLKKIFPQEIFISP